MVVGAVGAAATAAQDPDLLIAIPPENPPELPPAMHLTTLLADQRWGQSTEALPRMRTKTTKIVNCISY